MLRFDDGPKRPTNLSLNAKVLDMARELRRLRKGGEPPDADPEADAAGQDNET